MQGKSLQDRTMQRALSRTEAMQHLNINSPTTFQLWREMTGVVGSPKTSSRNSHRTYSIEELNEGRRIAAEIENGSSTDNQSATTVSNESPEDFMQRVFGTRRRARRS